MTRKDPWCRPVLEKKLVVFICKSTDFRNSCKFKPVIDNILIKYLVSTVGFY